MKYLVLMYEDEQGWAEADDAEREAYLDGHRAFDAAVAERAQLLSGEALAAAADTTTLRPGPAGRVLTDGPYAETVEQLGGFYLLEAADLDEVAGLCQLLPQGYTVEIRPVVDVEG